MEGYHAISTESNYSLLRALGKAAKKDSIQDEPEFPWQRHKGRITRDTRWREQWVLSKSQKQREGVFQKWGSESLGTMHMLEVYGEMLGN